MQLVKPGHELRLSLVSFPVPLNLRQDRPSWPESSFMQLLRAYELPGPDAECDARYEGFETGPDDAETAEDGEGGGSGVHEAFICLHGRGDVRLALLCSKQGKESGYVLDSASDCRADGEAHRFQGESRPSTVGRVVLRQLMADQA